MFIYEVLQCEDCQRTYKGKFKMHMDGKITCVDCSEPDVYIGVQIEEVQYAQRNTLMYEELSEMLLNDIENLYPLFPDKYKAIIQQLESADIQTNMPLIYFQYNSYQLVRIMREVAYVASHFLLKPTTFLAKHPQLKDQALHFVHAYFSLREKQLTPVEYADYWLLASNESLQQIKLHLPYLNDAVASA